ncbi:hypothetical protein B0H11DRAFT_1939528 [Mycena galericulata]|nr:hypothetical protein B0H11DRAFT_1939528 [Mycena galericulata]
MLAAGERKQREGLGEAVGIRKRKQALLAGDGHPQDRGCGPSTEETQPPANSDTSARISSLYTKLDALASKLNSIQIPQTTPTSGSIPSKSYASVVSHPVGATSSAHAPRVISCDIILTPKDRQNKVFTNNTHHAIQQQLNAFITGSSWLNEYKQVPFVRATTKYCNGNICIIFQLSHAAALLTEEADHWLPAFSSLLQLCIPTFPVVMHCVSTDFNVGSGLPMNGKTTLQNL